MAHLSLHSPIGDLTFFEHNKVLVAVEWGWGPNQSSSPFLENVKKQVLSYFNGENKKLFIKTMVFENDLENRVYKIMLDIPYGKTITYGEVAKLAKTGPRVVGRICGKNPIPVVIPCHRVMGANEKLTGYSGEGGLDTKVALLTLEGVLEPKLPL